MDIICNLLLGFFNLQRTKSTNKSNGTTWAISLFSGSVTQFLGYHLAGELTFFKLVTISGDSHSGANCQCKQRAIAVPQTVATVFVFPANKEEAGHGQSRLFTIVEFDVVSRYDTNRLIESSNSQ